MKNQSKYILAGISALCINQTSTLFAQEKEPNIVYILADDLGYGDIGCYGQKIIHTPNIDSLATHGMRFTNHYAGTTVSAPSRSSLLSGLHTGHTDIRGNKGHEPEGQEPIKDKTYTIAKMMKDAGYVTGAFGKWGLGFPNSEGDPLNQGFDTFYGYNCQSLSHNYYPYHLHDNHKIVILEGNKGQLKNDYAPNLIQQKAMQFIRNNKDKKFFLYLPYTLPHAELISPNDSILAMYKGKIKEKTPYHGVDSGVRYKAGGYCSSEYPHADFASMVTRLDAYVGQIINELKELGLYDNTLIIFTSDNGPHNEGGADPTFFNSSGPLRGIKRDVYEGGIRIPMIAEWQGKIKQGTVSDFPSSFWDMMPTFKAVINSKHKIKTDGLSILPTLLSEKGQKKHKFLYWEFHEEGGKVGIRIDNWKGIILNYSKNPNGKLQLYDLSTDIHEDNDVADQHPKIVKKMRNLIKKAHVKSDVFPFEWEKKN